MHLSRVYADPVFQTAKFLRDLGKLRSQSAAEFNNKPVTGISWLVNPRNEGIFKKLGFSSKNCQVEYFDLNAMFLPSSKSRKNYPSEDVLSKLLYSSFSAIKLSPHNLCSFITDGKIPDVGKITIRPEVFFKR